MLRNNMCGALPETDQHNAELGAAGIHQGWPCNIARPALVFCFWKYLMNIHQKKKKTEHTSNSFLFLVNTLILN